MLLARVWGDSAYRDPRTIDVHIRHLREKLEADAEGARVHLHRARRRLPLPRHRRGVTQRPAAARGRCATGSTLIFALIVLGAIGDRLLLRHAAAGGRSCATQKLDAARSRRAARVADVLRRDRVGTGRQKRIEPARPRPRPPVERGGDAARRQPSRRTQAQVPRRRTPTRAASRPPTSPTLAGAPRGRAQAAHRRPSRPRSAGRRSPPAAARARRRRSAASPCSPTRSPTCEANVALIRAPDPHRRRDRARRSPLLGRLPRRARARRARQAAGARGAQGRGGRLLQPDPGRLRRRARPARGRVRRHAAPARAARPRAQAVHRHRLARAAHADLLARRLPRAARGRGARRGDARASSSSRSAGRSTACASSRPSCSTSPGWSPARWSCGRSRPTSAQLARDVAGEFTPARRAARGRARAATCAGADRDRVRPRAGGPGDADPARQRARPHARRARPSSSRRRAANGQVTLEVSDAGLGIKRQTMPHIFEPFFTSDDGAHGAGLGLAIARELAERMAGELTVALRARAARPSRWRCRHEARARSSPRALAAALAAGGLRRRRRRRQRRTAAARPRTTDDDEGRGRSSGPERDGGGFDPQAIYRRESPGVVTVVSVFGSGSRLAARLGDGGEGGVGSGFVLNGERRDRHQRPRRHHRRGPRARKARQVYVEFADGNQVEAEIAATTRTPTSRCSRSTRRA